VGRPVICCFPQVNSKNNANFVLQTLLNIADTETNCNIFVD